VWGVGLFTIGIAEEDRPRRWRAHIIPHRPTFSEAPPTVQLCVGLAPSTVPPPELTGV